MKKLTMALTLTAALLLAGSWIIAKTTGYAEFKVTHNAADDGSIDVDTDSSGDAHAVYVRGGKIYYAKGLDGEEFVADGSMPAIAVDNIGNVHIVFLDSSSKYTYVEKVSGTWSALSVIPDAIADGWGNFVDIDTDSAAVSYITYVLARHVYLVAKNSGGFTTAVDIGYEPRVYPGPNIKIDSNGYYRITFASRNWGDQCSWSVDSLTVVTNAPSGNAGTSRDPTGTGCPSTGVVHTDKNALSTDAAGNTHVVYTALEQLCYAKIPVGTNSWSETCYGAGLSRPSIASRGSSTLLSYLSGSDLYYLEDIGAGFGTGFKAVSGVSSATAPVAALGSLYLYYAKSDGTDDEVYVYTDRWSALPPARLSGVTYDDSATAGKEMAGAIIEACQVNGGCLLARSDNQGQFLFTGLVPGAYNLRAFPSADYKNLIGRLGPMTIEDGQQVAGQNIILKRSTGIPPGITLTPARMSDTNVPIVYWLQELTLTQSGCAGGTARYDLIQNAQVVRTALMTEISPGNYQAKIANLLPIHNDARVVITQQCPGVPQTEASFDIWIDPSGVVLDTFQAPVNGATVTLYRSDTEQGPFTIVASGDAIMSPGNRTNPMQTDPSGFFGWDVVAGYYRVRAEKNGCVAASNHAQPYAETGVLTIPPPVTDLQLMLFCGYCVALPIILRNEE